MFSGLFLKNPLRIFGAMFIFHRRLLHGDFNIRGLGILQTLLVQQLLELHGMTSVKDVKPRIAKLLLSQTDINVLNTSLGPDFL